MSSSPACVIDDLPCERPTWSSYVVARYKFSVEASCNEAACKKVKGFGSGSQSFSDAENDLSDINE